MELPHLQKIYEDYRDQGLSIVAVEARRDRENAEKLIREKGLGFTFLESEDGNQVVHDLYKVAAFPSLFVLDSKGKIAYYHLGFEEQDEEVLREEAARLIGHG